MAEDVWAPFRFFVGTWEGDETGVSGVGHGEREYRFVLGGKFLRMQNRSMFPPQEKNPKEEVHEDEGFVSYDETRKAFVFRSFHKEGFVNEYVLEEPASDGKTFVWITERIENAPPGWRARLTVRIEGSDAFRETFEVAAVGRDWNTLLENRWRRVAPKGG